MPAFGRGFLFAALGPRGCAPLGTPAGCPLHRTPYKRLRRPAGGLSPRAGVPGRAPPTPCRQAWGRSGRVKGPCPRPYGAAGHTNPLTRPSLEKRARGRAGAEGHCRSGWGSRLAQRPRSSSLDAQERPNTPGWWLGCSSPAACHVANCPGGPPGGALDLLLLRAVSEKQLSAPSALRDWLWLWL